MVREYTANAVPASVPPVRIGGPRPLWSVMVPTYNHGGYLVSALESILSQDPGPTEMQIEIVDDCSTTSDAATLAERLGGGRIRYYRQPRNVGVTRNFNTCLERATGRLVHILHDDDLVLPGFYSALTEPFDDPNVGAAFTRFCVIDSQSALVEISEMERRTAGPLENWLERIAICCRIQCPSIVVRRSVYEKLGGFDTSLVHAADWEMWRRIARHYRVWFEPGPLACYRKHDESDTSKLVRSGANVADARKSILIVDRYLPAPDGKKLTRMAMKWRAAYAAATAGRMFAHRDYKAAGNQFFQALRCSPSPVFALSGLLTAVRGALAQRTADLHATHGAGGGGGGGYGRT